jgi:Tfp pilus assembly protein PilP
MTRVVGGGLAMVATCASLSAQAPAPPVTPATSAPPAPAGVEAAPYSYSPDGRRDPFVSLLLRGIEPARPAHGRAASGPSGLSVDEVSLKGIMQSRGQFVAMITGPDTKTFLVRANDRFLDGFVKAITAQTLVMIQELNHPLSREKQREVRKTLRAGEDAK